MASFSISYTDTSVTISVKGVSKGDRVRFFVREDSGSEMTIADKIYTASSSSIKKHFSGLSPETDYACNVEIGEEWIGTQYFTTEASISIDEWSWTSSNGSASTKQTKSAYNAVTGNGDVNDFSYLVWNDMVDKVYEILDVSGSSWDSEYASYSSTKMSTSNKKLTALRFNSLRYNIGSHYSTGISEVSRGDPVYGWYFTRLTNRINKWIATL